MRRVGKGKHKVPCVYGGQKIMFRGDTEGDAHAKADAYERGYDDGLWRIRDNRNPYGLESVLEEYQENYHEGYFHGESRRIREEERSKVTPAPEHDSVSHPSHYVSHPSGIECIQITEHMSFTLGNALKYIWRADLKGDAVEDLKKARWYLDREITRREKAGGQ